MLITYQICKKIPKLTCNFGISFGYHINYKRNQYCAILNDVKVAMQAFKLSKNHFNIFVIKTVNMSAETTI